MHMTPPPAARCLCFQNGLQKRIEKSRKQKKERRNRTKKVRGVKKSSGEKPKGGVWGGPGWACVCGGGKGAGWRGLAGVRGGGVQSSCCYCRFLATAWVVHDCISQCNVHPMSVLICIHADPKP